MKPIRLAFSDFPGPFNPERILALLKQRFHILIDQDKPDYVIYSIFGHDFMGYDNAVRIFFTGENVIPDFNLCDYAFGYDWIEFGDRYHRCPNYQLYDQYKDLLKRRGTLESGQFLSYNKTHFCNFIYTNGNGHPFRDELFHFLHAKKPVDSAGAHLRNVDDEIGPAYQGDWTKPKVEFQKRYRFTIAFENSSSPGYTTEKLVHALAADTIPIYWGNPLVGREFNLKRIINCHEYDSLLDIVNRIMEIEEDQNQFEAILREPFLPNDQDIPGLSDKEILDRFSMIFEQDHAKAFRRNFYFWGQKYERRRIEEVSAFRFLNRNQLLSKVARKMGWISNRL